MRNSMLAAVAAALCGIGNASAADLSGGMKDSVPNYEPAAGWTPMVVDWSGVYVGVAGGVALQTEKFYDGEGDACVVNGICPDRQGVGGLFGGTLGYNWQIRNLVLGFEGDFSWADVGAKLAPRNNTYLSSHIDAIATARLRTGYALGSSLFYVTGGAAFLETQYKAIGAGFQYSPANPSDPCNTGASTCEGDRWRTGFTVGAGYEAMLTSYLSVKAEYMYIGDPTHTVPNQLDLGQNVYGFIENMHVFRAGLNYKLGGGAPVAALPGGMKDAMAYDLPGGWSGAYVGVSGGIDLLSARTDDSAGLVCRNGAICSDVQGIGGLAGGTLGYNWQFRNLVLGFEGDISWADLGAKVKRYGDRWTDSHIDGIATARLRAGYAAGTNLFYVTGGAAFLDTQYKAVAEPADLQQYSATEGGWRTGIAVGAGYEAKLTSNLSWKAEYMYMGDPTRSVTNPGSPNDHYGFADEIQTFRIGLNYKLGGENAIYMPLK
jgi:outer membrane immunogenic protein